MARRDCPEAADVGAGLLAAVRIGLATLRQHLTDPDPKTALRAVAKLTKLLGVCARHGIAVGAEPEPPPVAGEAADVVCSRRERSSVADPEPLAERADHGMPLTSFLGAPAATGSGGDLAVTSSATPVTARRGLPSTPSPAAG